MTARHWVLIVWALLAWMVVAILWATGPVGCQPPDSHHRVTCGSK